LAAGEHAMGLRINTNTISQTAQRNLSDGIKSQRDALEHLSSGNRITKSADDAAGLAISEDLKAKIRGNLQAERNANDGISFVQTAEGGMNEISNILIRLRELSVQSASDTIGDKERNFSNLEFQSLLQEVDRISNSTEFSGKKMLTGEGDILEVQVGIGNIKENDRIEINPANANSTTAALKVSGLAVDTKGAAQENLTNLDSAISQLNGNRAVLGALQSRFESTISNLQIGTENLSAANSRIRDADVAKETAELTRANILTTAGVSVLAQANSTPMAALKLIA
jgi:flagellin